MKTTCIEKDCTITHEGKTFESGGAFIGIDKDGKHGGVVYGDWQLKGNWETSSIVSNWHGTVKVPARYGRVYRSNMGDKRRHVWFTWNGIKFHGVWCAVDWSQIVRVKEVSK